METTRIDSQTATAIRNKFVAPLGQFTCILVGKDGGTKFRRGLSGEIRGYFKSGRRHAHAPGRNASKKVNVTNPIQPNESSGVK
jgi:hypothetical protein